MKRITTYAEYKKEQEQRARVKKGVLWACVAVFGFAAVFGLGYLAGTRVSAQMAQIGECVADGGSGYMTDSRGGFVCLYE
jgi:hypothetical protein